MGRVGRFVALVALALATLAPTTAGGAPPFAHVEVRPPELIGRLPESYAHRIPQAAVRLDSVVRVQTIHVHQPHILIRPPSLKSHLSARGADLSRAQIDAATEDFMRALRRHELRVETAKIESDAQHPKAGGRLTISPAAAGAEPASPGAKWLLSASLWTGLRTDHVAESLHVSEEAQLNPRSAAPGELSPLAKHLRDKLKVGDYAAVADSFGPNYPVRAGVLRRPTTLWRLFSTAEGSQSHALGRFFFCCAEPSAGERWIDARGLATPPENIKHDLAEVTLPAGTEVLIGPIADQQAFDAAGGNVQIFVPHVESFPYDHYKVAASGRSPTDIVVKGDGNVLRFRR
jgi:hypothetical protein